MSICIYSYIYVIHCIWLYLFLFKLTNDISLSSFFFFLFFCRSPGSSIRIVDSSSKSNYTVQFRKGTKGPKLLFGGYSYFRNNGNAGRTYWLCSRNRYQKCKARLITKATTRELIVKNQIHNHEPDPDVDSADEQILYFDQVIGYLNDCGSTGKEKD